MQGKTHFFVGIASAVAICRPQTLPMLIAGTTMAGIGGVISDIDMGNSSAHRDADQVTAVIVCLLAAVSILDLNLHLGIYRTLISGIDQTRQITILLIFIAICAVGKSTKHRSFMHSLAALLCLGVCMYFMVPTLMPYFVVSFSAHILLDLLNRKKVRIFWPAKKGYCLGFCNSSGWVNKLCFYLGMMATVLVIANSKPVTETKYSLIQSLQYVRNLF